MNYSEKRLKTELESAGWTVFHSGIPDFICFKDGKIAFVELKESSLIDKEDGKVFTPSQLLVFKKLKELGFPVHVIYTGENLFDIEGKELDYEINEDAFVKRLEQTEGLPTIKDHVFFKNIGDYGQVVVPSGMRQKLGFFKKEAYAMVIVIPLITENSSLSKDEAYEYLKYLLAQSERAPE